MPDLDHEQIIDLPATLEPSHFENPVDTNLPSIAHRSAAESILSKNFQKVVTLVLEGNLQCLKNSETQVPIFEECFSMLGISGNLRSYIDDNLFPVNIEETLLTLSEDPQLDELKINHFIELVRCYNLRIREYEQKMRESLRKFEIFLHARSLNINPFPPVERCFTSSESSIPLPPLLRHIDEIRSGLINGFCLPQGFDQVMQSLRIPITDEIARGAVAEFTNYHRWIGISLKWQQEKIDKVIYGIDILQARLKAEGNKKTIN